MKQICNTLHCNTYAVTKDGKCWSHSNYKQDRKPQAAPKVHTNQCPSCKAYGYELQTFVKTAGQGTEIVECQLCGHQYTVKS